MRAPAVPPNEDAARLLRSPEHLDKIVSAVAVTDVDPYLPWDKLRWRTPPDGLDRLEWWAAVKLRRTISARPLPFVDVAGDPFHYNLPDRVLRLVTELSARAGGRIAMPEPVTNASTRDRYIVSSLIEESITSSQLEGAQTTNLVAKDMLRTGREPRDHSERMIWNNYRAMDYIREFQDEPLTPERICDLQRIVTEGTLDNPAASGRIQSDVDPQDRVQVADAYDVVLHRPPPPEQLAERIALLCDFANQRDDDPHTPWLSPVLRALTLHFMVGYDHYFEDGNGRTARALFYWCMLNRGFWLTEFVTISSILKKAPGQYGRSFLDTEQDSGDMTYFYAYHLGILSRAFDQLESHLAEKVAELQEMRALVGATPGTYNHRQLAIVELATKDPSSTFTAQSHARSHDVTVETARQDLTALERHGLLRRGKNGRQHVWRPAVDLATRLRGGSEAGPRGAR